MTFKNPEPGKGRVSERRKRLQIDPVGLAWRDIYRLLIGSVAPRPIAFVSTVDERGCSNAAPFSFFTAVSVMPPMICFSAGQREGRKKHTLQNIEETGDFVVNVVHEKLSEAVRVAAADYPESVSEIAEAGLHELPGEKVKSPRLAEAPINLECRLVQLLSLPESRSTLVIGEIVRFHIEDSLYNDGRINVAKLGAIGHLAGDLYCRSTDVFEMKRHTYSEEVS